MASGDSVALIKERLSIVDVVSPYVELQQAGKNFKGKSPFTNERTPSFYVSPDRGMYYCFSSNQGGDIFTFIQKMEGVEFKDALKILAEKAGVELKQEDPKKRTERDRMYDVLEEATRFFEDKRHDNDDVTAYLADRAVSQEAIAKWRIGYAPGPPTGGWRELKEHLEGKGFTKDEMLKAGLIKGADGGKEPYDLFRDRVMFPICDTAGKVVAYSGRIFSKDSEAPKYVNSPETDLFNKSEILFGYDKAKNGIRSLDFSLVVEGQFDVVLAHQAGYNNAVAVSGTALTPHHVMLLQRLSNRAVLALDADRAGIAAVKRAADIMLPRGMDIKVANMVGGKDPADMVKEDVGKLRKIIGSAKPIVEYLLDIYEAQKKDDRDLKLRVREEVLPFVAKIQSRIDQDHFEGVIAERLKTTKDAIHFEVERIIELQAKSAVPASSGENGTEPTAAAMSQAPVRKDDLVHYLVVLHELLKEPLRVNLQKVFYKIMHTQPESMYSKLSSEIVSPLTFTIEAHISTISDRNLADELSDKCNQLALYVAKERIQNLTEELRVAEDEDNQKGIEASLRAISAVQKEQNDTHTKPEDFLQKG